VKGVVVTSVSDNSPLADLGLQRGDVIESVNQKPVTSPGEVISQLDNAKNNKGDENVLILLNRNGVNQYVALSLSNQGNG
jgi:serine protease Do